MKLTLEEVNKMITSKGLLFIPNLSITSIEAFPDGLKKIHVANNNLCHLPELPDGLEELYCYDNNLIDMPELPTTLIKLDCSNNCLKRDISFDLTTKENKNNIRIKTDMFDELFYEEDDYDDFDDIEIHDLSQDEIDDILKDF